MYAGKLLSKAENELQSGFLYCLTFEFLSYACLLRHHHNLSRLQIFCLQHCRLFRRGLSYVGRDHLCHELWDQYIKFELSQEQWSLLAQIYIEALRFPTKKLHLYYDGYDLVLFPEYLKGFGQRGRRNS